MRSKNHLNTCVATFFLVSCVILPDSTMGSGQLWFGGSGPTNGTASGFSDNRIGYINSDGTALTTFAVNPSTNSYYCVGLDTNANLCFGLASDGSLHSGYIAAGPVTKTYSGTGLSGLPYVADAGDAYWISAATDVFHLYTADAGRALSADSPAVYARGPFGTLNSFFASYALLGDNVPPETSPYWIVWVTPPGDTNLDDEIAVIQYSLGNTFNDYSTIHVIDPSGVLGSYSGETLASLNDTKVPPLNSYTFGDMTVQFAGVEIGNWGVSDSVSASADIESMAITYASASVAQTIQITDAALGTDLAYSFTVDPTHHIIYMGLWGNDPSGADMIEIPYDPTDGQMSSPYDSTIGAITNESGVLMSFGSTDFNFVMAREMWVTPDGTEIYYVDNDFGDPGDFANNIKMNGVFVVDTTITNPQPEQLTLDTQFPGDNSQGYIVGMAVNPLKNLIYFATEGYAPGVGTDSNTIWSMPITGGAATAMPLPTGFSLNFPDYAGGCLALDSTAQTLYVSDQGSGNVMQLLLSANGLKFTGGTEKFLTLDANHLTDGLNGYPSAFVQGLTFDHAAIVSPPPPPTPTLNIVRQGEGILVSWPSEYSSYALQYASVLSTKGWSNYPGPFVTNGSVITVSNEINVNERFFRLAY